MRALAIVLLTLSSTFAPAQFAGVNIRKVFSPKITFVTSCSITVSSNPIGCAITVPTTSAGGTIIVQFSNFGNPSPTLTDSNTGTIALVPNHPVIWDGGSGAEFLWTISNAGVGDHVLSVSMTGSPVFPSMGASVFSNTSKTSPLATSSVLFSTVGNPPVPFVCGPVTTTVPNAFVYSTAVMAGGANLSPSTSPTLMTQAYITNGNNSGVYGSFPTPGVNTVVWNVDAQLPWVCDTVVLH